MKFDQLDYDGAAAPKKQMGGNGPPLLSITNLG
jgi:hypothetical protein